MPDMRVVDLETNQQWDFTQLKPGARTNLSPQRNLITAYLRKYFSLGSLWTIGTNWHEPLVLDFLESLRKFERLCLTGLEWILIIEIGEKGYLHAHYLCPGFVEKYDRTINRYGKEEREPGVLSIWRKCTGIKEPHVDVKRFYVNTGDTFESALAKTASYLAGYLTKTCIPGIRTFRSSKRLRFNLVKDGFYHFEKSISAYGFLTYANCENLK